MNTTATATATAQRTTLGNLRSSSSAPLTPAPQPTMKDITALPKPKQFPKMLEAFKAEIKVALPSHMNADRMARIALTCFRQNPTLAECDPQSVFACIVMASQLGLEPGLMGQAYLIPFNKKQGNSWVKECQLIPGYQGLVDLARRSGRIKSLEAHVVYENDHFECRFGLAPTLVHEPKWDGDRGAMRLAYAVAHLTDGGTHVEVMSRREIHGIRDRSQNVQSAKKYDKKTPWDTDEEQMWIKTVLRRISKFLPKSVELASALALEAANARGRSQELDLSSVIEGDFSHVAAVGFDDQHEDGEDDAGDNQQQETSHDSGAAGAAPSPEASKAATAASESTQQAAPATAQRRSRGTGGSLI